VQGAIAEQDGISFPAGYPRDEPVIQALTEVAERYPRCRFKKLFQVLRRQGYIWNHKRMHRIYCLLKLNVRRKGKQRLPVRHPTPLATPEALNQSWLIDFMHDALVCGKRFRTYNVVDDYNCEALAIDIDLNIPAFFMPSLYLAEIFTPPSRPD